MASRNHLNMLSGMESGRQAPNGNLEDSLQTELQLLLQNQHNQNTLGRERDFNIFRSGSAPPTVEGSLNAMGSLFGNSDFGEITGIASNNDGILTEDEIRSHPAYLSYYYSQCNNNPRLPPPLLSREDWRVAQRFQGGGSNGDIGNWGRKKMDHGGDSLSLFSTQPGLFVERAENDLMELRNNSGRNLSRKTLFDQVDRGSDGPIGLSSSGIGSRRKSFTDIVQEGLEQSSSVSVLPPRPSSCNAFGDLVNMSVADPYSTGLSNGIAPLETLHNGVAPHGLSEVQRHGTRSSSFASTGSSLSRSPTPELKIGGKSHSPGLPPVGSRICHVEKSVLGPNIENSLSSGKAELSDITSNLSSLRLQKYMQQDVHNHGQSQLHMDLHNKPDLQLNNIQYQNLLQGLVFKDSSENISPDSHYTDVARKIGIATHLNASKISSNGLVNFPKRTSSYANLYSRPSLSGLGSLEEYNVYHHNASTSGLDFVPGAYPINQKPNTSTAIRTHIDAGYRQSPNAMGNRIGSDLHSPVMDPLHSQFLLSPNYGASSVVSPIDSSLPKNQYGTLHGGFEGLPQAYLEALLSQQREQLELSLLGRSGGNCESYGNLSFGAAKVPHAGNPQVNSLLNSVGSGTHLFHNQRISQFNSMMGSSMVGTVGSWHTDNGNNPEGRLVSSLLDEFKNNKPKSFELSDIVNHVVEFSMDQYGSRFIQQKLETAAVEEKAKIFLEIIPHTRILMTDVFGNYVIQKFFEHGTENQRRELANQLTGHVLPLSLQMYGCRVIQKALEVVDVAQQTQMVSELDGSVIKCVRDQNGNHVIQKSIECVPQDRIQFIISSFYGQVVVLSTHPYGCRVIQRVLEHCNDTNTQQIIMKEIMQSVCTLAQDQYGNYVIQHLLEHGKPEERSAIISTFTGQIVRMSQQKFASNVVEKCLTFASPEERQLLVNEMLGSTDENEPLQAMMKDPFGNYVVQKALETCNDQSLEFILSRIKVHLNALKRYTYGKHIVSRIEKLIITGERRIKLSSVSSSSKLPN